MGTMKSKDKILVVDDDAHLRKTLSDILRIKGYDNVAAADGAAAIAAAEREPFGLALIDLMLPDMTGLEVMGRIKAISPLTEAVILTGNASLDTAIEATRKGAFSYILKPYQIEDLLLVIRHALDRQQAEEEIRRLASHPRLNPNPVIEVDLDGAVTYLNPAAEKRFPNLAEEGREHPVLAGLDAVFAAFREGGRREVVREVELCGVIYEERIYHVEESRLVRFHLADVTERRRAEAQARARLGEVERMNARLKELNAKLEQAQSQLLQSEKMASIGTLAAGVAHEINNPIGYVSSNLETLAAYVKDFLRLLDAYETAQAGDPDTARFAQADDLKRRLDLEFLRQDVGSLLDESRQGIGRVKKIVQDLKDFSRISVGEEWALDDIHKGLESTLNVIWNELKYNCEVRKEYGNLPPVECLISQLNQVFMNLLVNAAQAIKGPGTITLRTGTEGDQVWIEISDTGKGIPRGNLERIFDPFFTTKPIGLGTGLGLSVSYSIVQKHHGRIEVESEEGKGTTFRVWLPVKQPAPEESHEGGDTT
jgi:signal transduction histidine kinase/CheY-like chemotaxis protein